MNIPSNTPADPPTIIPTLRMPTGGAHTDFARSLDGALDRSSEAYGEARAAAGDLLATALVKPVLAQLRSSNMAAEPFRPGMWEKQFGPMMDAAWCEKLVHTSNWDVVDAVARGLMRKSAETAATAAAPRATDPRKDTP